MSAADTAAPDAACRESKAAAIFIAAYREGLGLTAVAVVQGAGGLRIVAGDAEPAPGDQVARWWCRRAADAGRVAAAATARLSRRESKDRAAGAVAPTCAALSGQGLPFALAAAAIVAAARRCHVALYADQHIHSAAMAAVARVEAEIERLRQAGEMKTVNRSYRSYRIEAVARGEKASPYGQWLSTYKANLVRQLAAAMR
jgi:hypothetical protein